MEKSVKRGKRRWAKRLLLGGLLGVLAFALLVTGTVLLSGDDDYRGLAKERVVNDVTRLNPIRVARALRPSSVDAVVDAVRNSRGPISIGGGRFSQGGQTAYPGSLHLDMRGLDRVIDIDQQRRLVTVQAGITWRKLQQALDPLDLSVRIMQTYSDFTVGGSLSVNVHGRYIGEGPLVHSVEWLKLVLADGSLVKVSRDARPELFFAAIGGYGGLGVIVEAQLRLAENSRLLLQTKLLPAADYREYFAQHVRNASDVVFHNGDLYPPDYDQVRVVSYVQTDKPVTEEARMHGADDSYSWQPAMVDFVAGSDFGKWFRRSMLDPLLYGDETVVHRNWEASYEVRELEPADRSESTYCLREYFVPVERFDAFRAQMGAIFREHDANIINVSIRHAHKDPDTLLSWARNEMFAFVVYYRQGTDAEARARVERWSQAMIEATIAEGGAHYLPYQIFETRDQFARAYPRADEYFALKAQVDPDYRFRNALFRKLSPREPVLGSGVGIEHYARAEEQTFLTVPEWYLVYNPVEYADFLERGKNPSDFPFLASIDEYWTLYDRVLTLTEGLYPDNDEYLTMLQVIGVSTTAEYLIKGAYESTLGRLSRALSGGENAATDALITQAQRAYADFIFDEPWYKFPFMAWLSRFWAETPLFGDHVVRNLERHFFFSLEYGGKALYAQLIGWAAGTAYEPAGEEIFMTVIPPAQGLPAGVEGLHTVKDLGERLIVAVPRWGGFTRSVPLLAKAGVRFLDIAGNKQIVLSAIAAKKARPNLTRSELLFPSRVVSRSDRERLVVLAQVEQLQAALAELDKSGAALEHLYDY